MKPDILLSRIPAATRAADLPVRGTVVVERLKRLVSPFSVRRCPPKPARAPVSFVSRYIVPPYKQLNENHAGEESPDVGPERDAAAFTVERTEDTEELEQHPVAEHRPGR